MLDDAEADYVSLRLRELAENPVKGGLSIEYSDRAKIKDDLAKALEKMVSRPWSELSLV